MMILKSTSCQLMKVGDFESLGFDLKSEAYNDLHLCSDVIGV